jgi:hypothetical protein
MMASFPVERIAFSRDAERPRDEQHGPEKIRPAFDTAEI